MMSGCKAQHKHGSRVMVGYEELHLSEQHPGVDKEKRSFFLPRQALFVSLRSPMPCPNAKKAGCVLFCWRSCAVISIAEPGVEPGPSAKETDKLPLLHPARCSEYPLEWLKSPWNGRKGPLRIPKVRTKRKVKIYWVKLYTNRCLLVQ